MGRLTLPLISLTTLSHHRFSGLPAPLYINIHLQTGALFDQWERSDVLFPNRSYLEASALVAFVYAIHRSNSLPCSIGHLGI